MCSNDHVVAALSFFGAFFRQTAQKNVVRKE